MLNTKSVESPLLLSVSRTSTRARSPSSFSETISYSASARRGAWRWVRTNHNVPWSLNFGEHGKVYTLSALCSLKSTG